MTRPLADLIRARRGLAIRRELVVPTTTGRSWKPRWNERGSELNCAVVKEPSKWWRLLHFQSGGIKEEAGKGAKIGRPSRKKNETKIRDGTGEHCWSFYATTKRGAKSPWRTETRRLESGT